jgi:GntR family transcriptional repressor for pyruvate dehydrogenase complex
MSIRSARKGSLVSTVVERLRHHIEQTKLKSGDRLPTEAELLEQLGVSRTVLREAIGRLETIGLVTVRHGQGMFVGDPDTLADCLNMLRSAITISPRDLTRFIEFRTALECYAARRAAELARPEHIARLEALCDLMEQPDLPYEEAIQDDFAFHLKLAEITGNPLLVNIMTVLQHFILAGMVQTTPKPRDRNVSHRLHRTILRAIKANDPEAAEDAMREHMRYTVERIADWTKRNGQIQAG